jgi:hypothetical protein
MKNLHIISTEKPSRLFDCFGKLGIGDYITTREGLQVTNQHIYITSDEEIKVGDWFLIIDDFETYVHKHKGDNLPTTYWKTIILTTDKDLIKDGVQDIDNEFLEWFVKNPSCDVIEVKKGFEDGTAWGYNFLDYKIIIPQEEPKAHSFCETPEEKCTMNYCDENGCMNRKREATEDSILIKTPKQETLEEAAKKRYVEGVYVINGIDICEASRECFIEGANYQAERMYSEEEVLKQLNHLIKTPASKLDKYTDDGEMITMRWFEQFKKK